MLCLPFLLIQDYIFNLCFSLKRQILNHKGLFVAGFQERKKLKKYNDLSKTPVKKEDRQKIISVEKLIENWTLEERLAGHNRSQKSQGSESDSTKRGWNKRNKVIF